MANRKTCIILGGGTSALFFAALLSEKKWDIHVYDKNLRPGKKFLLAGAGGFNLTHSETPETFLHRYTPSDFIQEAFLQHDNYSFIRQLQAWGIPTRIGSSKRVYPEKGIKPITVLQAILKQWDRNAVHFHPKSEFLGWDPEQGLLIQEQGKRVHPKADIYVYALGGASWSSTGSDGSWANLFAQQGIQTNPFFPSNCRYLIQWPAIIQKNLQGKALKNVLFSCRDAERLGEAIITADGIEGSGIYPLSPALRRFLQNNQPAPLHLDLLPSRAIAQLVTDLGHRKNESIASYLKTKIRLSETGIELLKALLPKEEFIHPENLAKHIKKLKLSVHGAGDVDKAISTVGGIDLSEITGNFELKKMRNHFVLGEMLDYDAPTGGYLIQSCYSMAAHVAQYVSDW